MGSKILEQLIIAIKKSRYIKRNGIFIYLWMLVISNYYILLILRVGETVMDIFSSLQMYYNIYNIIFKNNFFPFSYKMAN